MKKSIWIFLLAVLAPGFVLGWLALRSAEEQQIIFERRTAELYQKETENLAEEVRKLVDGERRAFGDVVHRLLANGDAAALARDFSNTLADAWPRKAMGFAISRDGQMLSPSAALAASNSEWREFLWNNSSFLCSTTPAVVYSVPSGKGVNAASQVYAMRPRGAEGDGKPALQVDKADEPALIAQKRMEPLPRQIEGGARRTAPVQMVAGEPAPIPAPSRDVEMIRGVHGKPGTSSLPSRAPAIEKPDAIAPSAQAAPRDGAVAPKPASSAPAVVTKREMAGGHLEAAAQPGAPLGRLGGGGMPGKDKAEQIPSNRRTVENTVPVPVPGKAGPVAAIPRIGAPAAESAAPEPVAVSTSDAVAVPGSGQTSAAVVSDAVSAKMADPVAASQMQNEPNRSIRAREESQPNARETEYLNRLVEPQQQIRAPTANWSSVVPATADFMTLTAWSDEGMVSRFVQDKLELIFWIRPPEAPEMVFGCLIDTVNLRDLWVDLFGRKNPGVSQSDKPPFVLALLDEKARPAAPRLEGEGGRDWRRPFVASEIGEMLPHWEAALYLATPTAIIDTARGFRRTLSFTIVGALALIALGGWLVVADVRRQLALAQQKTDFVSNVSHELKTPLTSIRMFAELLHDRPPPPEKQGQYLRIITVEAERLTRLINNVLDFAKLERKQRRFEKNPLDLHALIARVWEGQEMHLRDAGFVTKWEAAPGPYPVVGDEDALAQILVNLLSNAEKYSQETKEVELITWLENEWANVSVLDRGMGVPEGEDKKIFEAFYRAHDSLSSGIQGSGLGLTLACRLALEHGGEVRFERRHGGGSRFTLRVPLAPKDDTNHAA